MGSTEMNINGAYDEYKYFLTKYLLPLIGISSNNNLVDVSARRKNTLDKAVPFIRQHNNRVYFSSYTEDIIQLLFRLENYQNTPQGTSVNALRRKCRVRRLGWRLPREVSRRQEAQAPPDGAE